MTVHIRNIDSYDRIILTGGEYVATRENVILSTTLGSCVAVCLFDPEKKVMGMNHIMLSHERYESQDCAPQSGRFGHCAMIFLIKEMLSLGAAKKRIRAKMFGGASMFSDLSACCRGQGVGRMNADFVTKFLKEDGISLVSSELGGGSGRVISFHPLNYSVTVEKTDSRGVVCSY